MNKAQGQALLHQLRTNGEIWTTMQIYGDLKRLHITQLEADGKPVIGIEDKGHYLVVWRKKQRLGIVSGHKDGKWTWLTPHASTCVYDSQLAFFGRVVNIHSRGTYK